MRVRWVSNGKQYSNDYLIAPNTAPSFIIYRFSEFLLLYLFRTMNQGGVLLLFVIAMVCLFSFEKHSLENIDKKNKIKIYILE